MSEGDTLPQGGTETAQPSTSIENPENWDYYDPDDEKQDTVAAPEFKGNESEKAEAAESGQEAEQSESAQAEAADEKEPSQEDNPKIIKDDSVMVEMPDGTLISLSEAKKGYLRQDNFSRKTEAIARKNEFLDSQLHQSQERLQAIEAFVSHILPPRPDPALAQSNPGQFVAMQEAHRQGLEMLAYARNLSEQTQAAQTQMSQKEMEASLEAERPKLLAAIPSLATKKGKAQFIEKAKEVISLSGKTPDFLERLSYDHTNLVLLNYAIEGLAARKAKEAAAKKVADVPPMIPAKQRQTKPDAMKNREAMARLSRTGSIHDAVNVDF